MSRKRKTRFEDLPYHLTPKEIEALRDDLKRAHSEATRIFAEYAKREARQAKQKAKRRGCRSLIGRPSGKVARTH